MNGTHKKLKATKRVLGLFSLYSQVAICSIVEL